MARWYVTKTWEDWPEGGSFGTVVEAKTAEAAEQACVAEMAQSREIDGDALLTAKYFLATYGEEWYTVDCFDLDEFIAQHKREV